MKRRVLQVRWEKRSGQWALHDSAGGEGMDKPSPLILFPRKAAALVEARAEAQDHKARGGLAQLRVFKKNGQIQTEHTYGKDPRKSKG